MSLFIANYRFNKFDNYRMLVKTINTYLRDIEFKISGKDSNLCVSQFPDVVELFNEFIDWLVDLNSGFADMLKSKIK